MSNTMSKCRKKSQMFKDRVSAISDHLYMKRLDKITHKLSETQSSQFWSVFEVFSILQFRNSNDPFLNLIVILIGNGSLKKIETTGLMVWSWWLHQTLPKIQNGRVSLGSPLALFLIDFWNPTRVSEPRFTSNNWMELSFSYSLVNRRCLIMIYDNNLTHFTRMPMKKLTDVGYETMRHSPRVPDLSPTDYHFSILKIFKPKSILLLRKYRNCIKKCIGVPKDW